MTLARIAEVVGGTAVGGDDVTVTGPAFVDSRRPEPGGLFVAVTGLRVDGHDFAVQAVEGGAAAVLASRPVGVPAVVVPDVVAALGTLAREVVAELADLTVVGITGSQGKTSTKDLLADALGAAAPTVAPSESFNNEIGVPLTALRVTPETRYLVAEMGARGRGHIRYLAGIVAPYAGVVLNVGVAHLGEFGSRDEIAVAKGELVEALPADGLAVLNADDPRVLAMAARTSARTLTFGAGEGADVRVGGVGMDADGRTTCRLGFEGRTVDLRLRYVGRHHALNAAAAAAAALGLGLDLDHVAAALEAAVPRSRWRMEVTESPDGVLVVNDAYNANPDSVRAAVSALVELATLRSAARTVAVLGDMRELGAASRREHESLGRYVAAAGVDRLVVVGEEARPVHEAATADRAWAGSSVFFPGAAQALDHLAGDLRPGDAVLVKASRAAGLDTLAAALAAGRAGVPCEARG